MTEITDFASLQGLLSDAPLGDAAAYAAGAGPALFDLRVLSSPDGEAARRFLNSAAVSAGVRSECAALEEDLRRADADGDGFVNRPEMVAYAAIHPDRWSSTALFAAAADAYLNRLPAYAAQPDLTREEVSRLWGLLNHFAEDWEQSGAPRENWGTVYGLSLADFPSEDTERPPVLVQRALSGTLSPRELSVARHLLHLPRTQAGEIARTGSTPLSTMEIGILSYLLQNTPTERLRFMGMTLAAGDEAGDAAGLDCQAGVAAAQDAAGLEAAFEDCIRVRNDLDRAHPERVSSTVLLLRAYTGDLTPAETGALRLWMQEEARTQGLVCDGTADCLAMGFVDFFRSIAEDPLHFAARNGAFLAGSILYRRLVLQNLFGSRLQAACGNGMKPTRSLYRDYETFARSQMAERGFLRRLPRRIWSNPFVGLAAFNLIASQKDSGHLALDIPTDMALIPLFEAFETREALNGPLIRSFAAQSSLCEPAVAPEPGQARTPAARSILPSWVNGTNVFLGVLTAGLGVATVAAFLCPFDGPAGEGVFGLGTVGSGSLLLARLGLIASPTAPVALRLSSRISYQ